MLISDIRIYPVANREAAEAPAPGAAARRRRGGGGGEGTASEQGAAARSEALEALAQPSWIRAAAAKP